MIAVRIETPAEAFSASIANLVRLLERRLCGGNRPELQVEMNEAARRVRDTFRSQVRDTEMYYLPILRGLQPELADQVHDLSLEHEDLSSLLDKVVEHVEEGRPKEALDALKGLVWSLIDHSRHQGDVVDKVLEKEKKAP